MTIRFATGFNPDPTPRDYPSHKDLLAAPVALASQTNADMYRFRGPFIWQDIFSMCFPCACSRAEYMQRLLPIGTEEELLSLTWGYFARAEAYRALPRELQPKTLDDTGTSAAELEVWYQGMGVLLNKDLPGPMTQGFDPSMVYNVPSDKAFQDLVEKAYDAKRFVLHEVQVDKGSRVDAMRDLLKSFIAPILTWNVDSAYMRNQGEVVLTMNESDPLGGGHAQVVLTIPDLVVVDNWWRNNRAGIQWGDFDGTGIIDPGLIERMDSVRIFCLKPATFTKGTP
jgi:hypothetical protein